MNSDSSDEGGPPMVHRTQTAPCAPSNYEFDFNQLHSANLGGRTAMEHSDDEAPPVGFRRTVTLDPTVFFHGDRDIGEVLMKKSTGGDSDEEAIGRREDDAASIAGGGWAGGGKRKNRVSSRCFVCQTKVMLKNESENQKECFLCSMGNGTIVSGLKGPSTARIRSITFCPSCMQTHNTRNAVREAVEEPGVLPPDENGFHPQAKSFDSFLTHDGCLKLFVCVRVGGCWNRIRRKVIMLPRPGGPTDRGFKGNRRLLANVPNNQVRGLDLSVTGGGDGPERVQMIHLQQQQQQQQQQNTWNTTMEMQVPALGGLPNRISRASFGDVPRSLPQVAEDGPQFPRHHDSIGNISNMSMEKGSNPNMSDSGSSDGDAPPGARRAVTLDPHFLGSGAAEIRRPSANKYKGGDLDQRQNTTSALLGMDNPPEPSGKRVVSFAFGNRKKNRVSSRCFVCQKKVQMKNEHDVHNACQLCSCESGAVVRGLKGPTSVTIRSITFCGSCVQAETTRNALQSTIDGIVTGTKEGKSAALTDFETDPNSGSLKLYVCVRVGGCWSKIRCSHDLASSRISPQVSRGPAGTVAQQKGKEAVMPSQKFGEPSGHPNLMVGSEAAMPQPVSFGGPEGVQGLNLWNPAAAPPGASPGNPTSQFAGLFTGANPVNPTAMEDINHTNNAGGMPWPANAGQQDWNWQVQQNPNQVPAQQQKDQLKKHTVAMQQQMFAQQQQQQQQQQESRQPAALGAEPQSLNEYQNQLQKLVQQQQQVERHLQQQILQLQHLQNLNNQFPNHDPRQMQMQSHMFSGLMNPPNGGQFPPVSVPNPVQPRQREQ